MKRIKTILLGACVVLLGSTELLGQEQFELANDYIQIQWQKSEDGYVIDKIMMAANDGWEVISNPSGEYTLLWSKTEPKERTDREFTTTHGEEFPGSSYKYLINTWKNRTSAFALNVGHDPEYFYPSHAEMISPDELKFSHSTIFADFDIHWKLDRDQPQDILVWMACTVKVPGYYSLASPSLLTVDEKDLKWATVPGYFHGDRMEENLPISYAYGNGVPALPIIFSEKTASTLSPIIESKEGFTLSAIAMPDMARNPWIADRNNHHQWQLGLSHKNSRSLLSPTLYYPIMGQGNAYFKEGQSLVMGFRFHLSNGDWFSSMKHAAYTVYDFEKSLQLRRNQESLSHRLERMVGYLTDPETSLWRVETFEGREIGAQAYLGGVVGADRDAMKNADYGAMWMLAQATDNPLLKEKVLPYALQFKLAQQQMEPGFFQGAAIGQYYLSKSKRFVEEWGDMVEPIALTYYIMLDIGNMLLFEPDNPELKERLGLGAALLMDWQREDGSWPVAFNREEEALFKELQDFRPTFYGLLVAYRMLGDEKYLMAAKKGADWFWNNGVAHGSFLGVCGDARYVPDFATGQTAQAFLDLYESAPDPKYLEAAVKAAKVYTSHVYTHPIADKTLVNTNGKLRQNWEISQAGLSFEHGGAIGSANSNGPILLASHAGMFIRMHALTGERFFADMARAAAVGRHAFVDEDTGVASYYWRSMDAGAGPFPHHAWWQVGWITDYLMAELALRSANRINFPSGFVTPKVGPHKTYGFAPGTVLGQAAGLEVLPGFVKISNPNFEHIIAASMDKNKRWILLLNQYHEVQSGTLNLAFSNQGEPGTIRLLDAEGKAQKTFVKDDAIEIRVDGYGLAILEIQY